MIILKADNITAGYTKEVNILYDVDIRLKSGQIVTIIGPNGAGKSTLLKTIFGLLQPSNGKITLKEEDITGLKPDKVAKKGISYVPQVDNVFPRVTIQEKLEMGAFIRDEVYSQRGFCPTDGTNAREPPATATTNTSGEDARTARFEEAEQHLQRLTDVICRQVSTFLESGDEGGL